MSSALGRTVTQLVFTVAGYYLGGPLGGAIGSALGAYAGFALFPLDPAQGPRLSDLKAQISSYGGAINRVWGRMRVGGNVIWASDLIETEKVDEVGGKGGPSQEVVTYLYSINAAVAICAGPIAGVRRIWADAELVYDMSDLANVEASQASYDFGQYFTLYPGNTTQLPDPTLEAALGVGNVPAYRGTAYIVFNNLPLERYGNRFPNFEFEVVSAGAASAGARVGDIAIAPQYHEDSAGNGIIPIIMPGRGVVRVANSSDNLVRVYSLAGTFSQLDGRNTIEKLWPVVTQINTTRGGYGLAAGAKLMGRIRSGSTVRGVLRVDAISGAGFDCMPLLQQPWLTSMVPCCDQRVFVAFSSATQSGVPTAWDLIEWTGSGVAVIRSGSVPAGVAQFVDNRVFGSTGAFGGDGTGYQASCMESDRQTFWIGESAGDKSVEVMSLADDGTLTLLRQFVGAGQSTTVGAFALPAAVADAGYFYFVGGLRMNVYHRGGALSPSAVPVSTVVTDVCTAAGYAGGDINAAALTDTVTGYALGQSSTARAGLDQLRSAFFFDAVESDDLIKFVKRGGTAAASIPIGELGELDQPGPLSSTRAQETDLPARINVAYLSADADYQIGTQSARRETTGSRQQQDIQIAIAMTDLAAAQVADVLLRDLWQRAAKRYGISANIYASNLATGSLYGGIISINAGNTAQFLPQHAH